ncbi:FliH/SctL family protein [Natranaerofaba carboxydovora]|uniref:FliH/SctL family protein n=1 Tax=Natranaerofaba carboxydovora TaxID=2742683 RepID=UPI001F142885|nr:FliH/SctL family protein [Natranaerofaba carboxydovora]UMZ73358.1 Yop proteins translocation protein L [Natranaerofaba carboxydovora]
MSKVFKSNRVQPKKEPYSLPVKSKEELLKMYRKVQSKNPNEAEDLATEEPEISEEEKKAKEEAEKIIESAKVEAENKAKEIIDNAKAQEEAIKKEAEKTGYEEGYKAGYDEGKNLGLKEIKDQENDLLKNARSELDKAIQKRNDMLTSIEREVCELVFLVAEKILEKKVNDEEELINTMVKNGLSALKGQNNVTIKCHPYDYPKIEDAFEKIKKEFSELFLELKEDTNVSQGAPLLSVDSGYVELDVSKQARELHQNVKQVIQSE